NSRLTTDVLGDRDQFHVADVHARMYATQVVDGHAFGNRTVRVLPGDTVGQLARAIDAAAAGTLGVLGALPDEAVGLGDLGPEVRGEAHAADSFATSIASRVMT